MGDTTITAVVPVNRSVRVEHPWTRGLPANVKIVDRGAAGIWAVETPLPMKVSGPDGSDTPLKRPDSLEQRVDSFEDAAFRRAGKVVWYDQFLPAKSAK